MKLEKFKTSKFKAHLKEAVQECEGARRHVDGGEDITLGEYMQGRFDVTMEGVYEDLGVQPSVDTIQNLIGMPDASYRWLIPEIYRDSIRLGFKRAPIYPSVIAAEQSVKGLSVIMPAINMSDAAPMKVGMAETIQLGSVSFQQKSVKISKIGRGIQIPDEVIQYAAINVVGLFLGDFGVKLGMGMDSLLLNTLTNGDQADGSDSASIIGVKTPNTLEFRDLLKLWVRMARLGKNPSVMIGGEAISIELLEMLTATRLVGEQRAKLDIKTPIPQNSSYFIHGAIPDNQLMILDPKDTIIKLNAQPLLVETERIVSNQTNGTYCSLSTGFATLFQDSRVIMDMSLDFADGHGFPTYMDPTPFETVVIK